MLTRIERKQNKAKQNPPRDETHDRLACVSCLTFSFDTLNVLNSKKHKRRSGKTKKKTQETLRLAIER
jgi:hypothetical protein